MNQIESTPKKKGEKTEIINKSVEGQRKSFGLCGNVTIRLENLVLKEE